MSLRLPVLVLAPLLATATVTATAYAQAPGETVEAEPAAPTAAGPSSAPRPSVMARRWSIGLAIGGASYAPESDPEATSDFNVAQLAVRYRATRRLELEAAFAGGRQVLEDNREGDLAATSVTLNARLRFRPEHRWSWFAMAGVGGTSINRFGAGAEVRDASTRGTVQLGLGVERRFGGLALQAEVRAIGLGPIESDSAVAPPPMPEPVEPGMTAAPAPGPAVPARDKLSGGLLTIGAAYYF